MKNSSKKTICLVLVFTLLMAIFMPTIVRAEGEVSRVSTKFTFTQADATSETVASSTNMEEYINSKKSEFLVALSDGGVTPDSSNSNIDPTTLFSTSEPYKYAVVNDITVNYSMLEGVLTQVKTVNYIAYTVTLGTD